MARRPLVATIVTTCVGALLGALLGALVGRVIALFGDATVQVSVPMVFCGTLGFFVGGASAAKGSLDRFGAKRSGLGAFVAIVVLIAISGGASVSHQPALVIFIAGIVAAVLAGAGATLVGGPQPAPVARGGVPRAVAPPREAEAAPQEQVEAEYLDAPPELQPDSTQEARPRRDRPLRREDAAAPRTAKRTSSDITPPPAPRARRSTTARKGGT